MKLNHLRVRHSENSVAWVCEAPEGLCRQARYCMFTGMKSRQLITAAQVVILGLLLALIAGNLSRIKGFAQQLASPAQNRRAVSLFLARDSQANLAPVLSKWADNGIQDAVSIEALMQSLADAKVGDSMWLDAAAFRALDPAWLKSKYRSGVAVVAIDVPVSELAAKVGARPDVVVSDLNLSYAKGRPQVSMCQEYKDNDEAFATCYTDFASDLCLLPTILQPSIQDAANPK